MLSVRDSSMPHVGRPVELLGESACQAENKQLKSELAALKSKYAVLEVNGIASAGKVQGAAQ